ncbi:hypothetical protein C8N26_1629 [Tenacibaculum lutimaris]|uniref:Uncharacterized protein n=1 Tax=Tenacibaculum lutimaris TaxID=285258 RepID=A0A420E298_9FLAO|nr:hypothetical protein [Tenacibaculum lutimaris]RKF03997.1 hypothetical protein C8N26_1629 [Tenacibaculum lutimaris]
MIKKYTSTLLNGIYILTIILFVFDWLTSFEIKNQAIKSFSYFGVMVLTPLTLVWNLWAFKSKKWKLIGSTIPTLTLIGILIIGPLKIVFSTSAWKTQKVIYQNGHLNFKKVEFQTQDIGALGYNKRTVEVIYLTDLFMLVNPVEKDIDDRVEWIKVDKEVNELRLKFP